MGVQERTKSCWCIPLGKDPMLPPRGGPQVAVLTKGPQVALILPILATEALGFLLRHAELVVMWLDGGRCCAACRHGKVQRHAALCVYFGSPYPYGSGLLK